MYLHNIIDMCTARRCVLTMFLYIAQVAKMLVLQYSYYTPLFSLEWVQLNYDGLWANHWSHIPDECPAVSFLCTVVLPTCIICF